MKRPNGYGNVSKISGKRRRPWRARVTVGWDLSDPDKPKQQFFNVGTFATRREAMDAIAKYYDNPTLFTPKPTFSELFTLWAEKELEKGSESRKRTYNSAYKACSALHNKSISVITLNDMQAIINLSPNGYQSRCNIKNLCSALINYSIANRILPPNSNYCSFLDVGENEESHKHYTLTRDELARLWQFTEDDNVKIILMMIYSGVRPIELLLLDKANINMSEHYFTVKKGKTEYAARIVPIADKTYPFFQYFIDLTKNDAALFPRFKEYSNPITSYNGTIFKKTLKKYGLLFYTNPVTGEETHHSSDDSRHTFASLWHDQDMSESARRFIQGHSPKGTGEKYYIHPDPAELLKLVNRL